MLVWNNVKDSGKAHTERSAYDWLRREWIVRSGRQCRWSGGLRTYGARVESIDDDAGRLVLARTAKCVCAWKRATHSQDIMAIKESPAHFTIPTDSWTPLSSGASMEIVFCILLIGKSENYLINCPQTVSVCVVGINDFPSGDLSTALVPCSVKNEFNTGGEISDTVGQAIADSGANFVESLHVTPSGKLIQRVIKDQAEILYAASVRQRWE